MDLGHGMEDGKETGGNERRLLIEHCERGKETMTANFGAGRAEGKRERESARGR